MSNRNELKWINSAAPELPNKVPAWNASGNPVIVDPLTGDGADIAITARGIWEYQSLTTTPVADGKVRFDSTTIGSITEMRIAQVTDEGTDAGFLFATLKPGDDIYFQLRADATKWARFTISATPVDNGSWWTFPVTLVNSGGVLPGSATKCIVRFTAANLAYNYFKGSYASLGALNTAVPTANPGDYALVDVAASPAQMYIWDATDSLWRAAGGSITLGAIGSTPNANAATLTGSVLNLEPASATFGGLITTGAQTLAGAKTLSATPTFSTMTIGSVLFASTAGLLAQDNTNFKWDATNKTLLIGAVPNVATSAANKLIIGGGTGTTIYAAVDILGNIGTSVGISIKNQSAGNGTMLELLNDSTGFVRLSMSGSAGTNQGRLQAYGANGLNLYVSQPSGAAPLTVNISVVEKFRIMDVGVGIDGVTTPSAKLHIAANTAAVGTAPLKFNAGGAAMATPEDGAFEYHTSHLWFTIGSTRYQLDQQPAGGISIYTGDGSLAGNRILTGAGNTLTFTGLGGYTVTTSAGNISLAGTDVATLKTTSNNLSVVLTEATGMVLTGGGGRPITLSGGTLALTGTSTGGITFNTTFSPYEIKFSTNSVLRATLSSTGFGFGIGTASARLHTAAHSATAGSAPIKLTTGTAMTAAEDGAFEYHTSHLYFTIGSTRFQLDQQSGGGGVTLGAIGSTPNANAATLTGSVLNLEPASGSFGGIVTTAAQSFNGTKTFSAVSISSITTNAIPYGPSLTNSAAQGNSFGIGIGIAATSGDAINLSRSEGGIFGMRIANTNAALGSVARVTVTNDASVIGVISMSSSGSTVPSQYSVFCTGAGGMLIGSSHASGILTMTAGGAVERARITAAGLFGIGITGPTARLHLSAGTAAVNTAPFKLTTGTALTTPEDGAVEYHGSHLWFTIGSTRYQLDQQSGGGGVTLTAIGGTPNANGLTLTGSVLNLEPASISFGGAVTTVAQTFTGAKTFATSVAITGMTAGSVLFYTGGVIAQDNAQLFWSTGSNALCIGTSTVLHKLTVESNANAQTGLSITNTDSGTSARAGIHFAITGFTVQMGVNGAGTVTVGNKKAYQLDLNLTNGNGMNVYTTSTVGNITFCTNADFNNVRLHIGHSGVGIGSLVSPSGVLAPTAAFHLPAHGTTANTAPLKFTSGTAMTTPEDGAVEYHSSHLYFTIGSTRYQLDNAIVTADNGLTKTGTNVQLGGPLTANTTVTSTGGVFSIQFGTSSNPLDSFQANVDTSVTIQRAVASDSSALSLTSTIASLGFGTAAVGATFQGSATGVLLDTFAADVQIQTRSSGKITLQSIGLINFNPTGVFQLKGVTASTPTTMFFRGDGTWAVPAGGGGSPGGANTEIQINNSSAFGGGKVFISTPGNLILGDSSVTGNRTLTVQSSSTNSAMAFEAKGSGSFTWLLPDTTSKTVTLSSITSAGTLVRFTNSAAQGAIGLGTAIASINNTARIGGQTADYIEFSMVAGVSGKTQINCADGAGAGMPWTIKGMPAGGTNQNGGNIIIEAGDKIGTGLDGNIYIQSLTGYLIIATIPTSSAGLPSGAIWSNSNVLTRVP